MVPPVTFSLEGTIVGSVTFYVTEYGAVALQFQLQSLGVQIPPYFLLMLPYLLTLAILLIFGQKNRYAAPAGLATVFQRMS